MERVFWQVVEHRNRHKKHEQQPYDGNQSSIALVYDKIDVITAERYRHHANEPKQNI